MIAAMAAVGLVLLVVAWSMPRQERRKPAAAQDPDVPLLAVTQPFIEGAACCWRP